MALKVLLMVGGGGIFLNENRLKNSPFGGVSGVPIILKYTQLLHFLCNNCESFS